MANCATQEANVCFANFVQHRWYHAVKEVGACFWTWAHLATALSATMNKSQMTRSASGILSAAHCVVNSPMHLTASTILQGVYEAEYVLKGLFVHGEIMCPVPQSIPICVCFFILLLKSQNGEFGGHLRTWVYLAVYLVNVECAVLQRPMTVCLTVDLLLKFLVCTCVLQWWLFLISVQKMLERWIDGVDECSVHWAVEHLPLCEYLAGSNCPVDTCFKQCASWNL